MYLQTLTRPLHAGALAVALAVPVLPVAVEAQAPEITPVNSVIAAVEADTVENRAAHGLPPRGADAPPIEVLLQQLIERNPDLLAAQYFEDAASERIARARALPPPEIAFEFEDVPFRDPFPFARETRTQLLLKQPFPAPGTVGARVDVQRAGFEITRAERRDLELDLIASFRVAYADLWRWQELGRVNREIQVILSDLVDVTVRLIGTGQTQLETMLITEAELARRRTEERLIQAEYNKTLARVNALLGNHPAEPLGAVAALNVSLPDPIVVEQLETRMMTRRPDLDARRFAIQQQEAEMRLARRARLPEFAVEVMTMGAGTNMNAYGAGLTVTIPFAPWASPDYRRRLTEAQYMRDANRRLLEAKELEARRNLREALEELGGSVERLRLFEEEVLPLAEEAAEASDASFRAGRVDYILVLESYRTLQSIQSERIEAAVDVYRAVAELERELGFDLNRLE